MFRSAWIVALAAIMFTVTAFAQRTSALINEALDQPVKLDLNGTLPQAIDAIANQTGVRIRATPSVWELLPWGEQTNLSAKIENQTLREALDAITRKLGLRLELKDEYVELSPMGALARLGRRANPAELSALDLLCSTPLGLNQDRPTVKALLAAVDQKLADAKSPFAVENRAFDGANQDQTIPLARNATLADALDAIDATTSATWYPWGKSVVILGKADQIRGQLAKTISAHYDGVEVAQVLTELSQRAGVPISIEPGALQRIAPEFRNIRLLLDNASIRQTLDTVSGFTGLTYTVTDAGIHISNKSGAGAPAREPLAGLLTLPDLGIAVPIPQSQMPDDLKAYLKFKARREMQKMRKMMAEEGFIPPATQPATQSDDL